VKTVHLILNAHLDPVWLWSWTDGLDEVLNTSHYICNLLDRHPDIIYTRGEAWIYQQIRQIDPRLFERIQAHVKAGRWSPVGGWYIQPDCNLPSGFAMKRQLALGQNLFGEYFGTVPSIGYNVDSFGHAATLPGLMRQAGQHSYVMMRPQEFELALPARLFRWRGYADGPEVTTFRIAQAYCTPQGMNEDHLRASLTDLPVGVNHTMCFVGVGDHGGGPTEEMIAWCRAHRDFEGARLEFSSPEKFFAAIQPDVPGLPLFVGEMQMHAIGCYSVHRSIKTAIRRAEHGLLQAEIVAGKLPALEALSRAWERVCFHHFHDTICGTCLPSAYPQVEAQLGQALAIADETAALALRKHLLALGEDPAQRIVLFNASDLAFNDHVEVEPWLEWTKWNSRWHLIDEQNRSIDYQTITPESGADNQVRLLFPLRVEPAGTKVLRIVASAADESAAPGVSADRNSLRTPSGTSVDLDTRRILFPTAGEFSLPDLLLYPDVSDTWSHGFDRYARVNGERAVWEKPQVIADGPLMASLFQTGLIGRSELRAEWRVYRDKPWIECLLRIVWNEKYRVLKFEWELPAEIVAREDGIMGASLKRQPDGRELPLRDWTRLQMNLQGNVHHLGIVAPDVFALSCEPRCAGFTLLRAATMAYHIPQPAAHPRDTISDRGEHAFRFRLMAGAQITAQALDEIATAWQRPLLRAEVTRGMRNRFLREDYRPPTF
jgi:alpha-mannosidase